MEADKEKFRAYLENAGVMSALTNVFVALYESTEKPQDALTYLIETLDSKSTNATKVALLEEKCLKLESENEELKKKLVEFENKREEKLDITEENKSIDQDEEIVEKPEPNTDQL